MPFYIWPLEEERRGVCRHLDLPVWGRAAFCPDRCLAFQKGGGGEGAAEGTESRGFTQAWNPLSPLTFLFSPGEGGA